MGHCVAIGMYDIALPVLIQEDATVACRVKKQRARRCVQNVTSCAEKGNRRWRQLLLGETLPDSPPLAL